MITIKFIGGAKKSFQTEQLELQLDNITIKNLFPKLDKLKPRDTIPLDSENTLVAVNGADSSAMDGPNTVIKDGDIVSIIPVIHGGSAKKILFESHKRHIQILELKSSKKIDTVFLDELRNKYPKIKLQAISSNFVLNQYHLKRIILLSLESEKCNILLSKKIETDLLMRFAITKQISDAIKTVGIKPGKNFMLIAIGNKTVLNSLYSELYPDLQELFSKNNQTFLKRHFKINQKHIDSVHSKTPFEDILIEKASILV